MRRNKLKAVISILSSVFILIEVLSAFIKKPKPPRPLIIAHRGDHRDCVENTIESLNSAARYQVDYVELDICESKDGEIFVFHDKSLYRSAGVHKEIDQLTGEEIRSITLTQNGHTGSIPTFEAFLIRAKSLNQKLLIEIIIHGDESENYIHNASLLIRKHLNNDDFLIQSLNKEALKKVNEITPDIKVGLIAVLPVKKKTTESLSFLSIPREDLAIDILWMKHLVGIPIFVWTIDKEKRVEHLINKGADAIITNESQELIEHFG